MTGRNIPVLLFVKRAIPISIRLIVEAHQLQRLKSGGEFFFIIFITLQSNPQNVNISHKVLSDPHSRKTILAMGLSLSPMFILHKSNPTNVFLLEYENKRKPQNDLDQRGLPSPSLFPDH